MGLSNLDYYFITVNILGFILFIIHIRLCANIKGEGKDLLLKMVSLCGGAPGIFIAILIFDRKATKENMMLRVFVCCFLIIQIAIFLMLKGFLQETITFAFWEFFKKHRAFAIYLLAINIITLITFGIDKRNALSDRFRIRITTLLGLSFVGGAMGGLIAMYAFRHKTKKNYFTVGLPLMVAMQTVVIFFLMNIRK